MSRRPCFFKILLSPFPSQLPIPYAFVKNLETDLTTKFPQEFVLQTSRNRFWHVDVEKDDDHLYFKKGWKEFVRQNSIEKGDLIVFRYHGNFKFKLEIYGRNCCRKGVVLDVWEKGKQPFSSQHEQKTYEPLLQSDEGKKRHRNVQTKILRKLNSVSSVVEMSDRDSDDQTAAVVAENQKKSGGLEAAQCFNSRYPFFKVVIRHAYLHSAYLHIPNRFMRTNGLKPEGKNIKLEVSNKTWLVKMSKHPMYSRFYNGWSNFVKDNSLQEGDVCLFELIDNDDITFRVTIFMNIK